MPLTALGRIHLWIAMLVLLMPANWISLSTSSQELGGQSADLNIKGDHDVFTSTKFLDLQHLTSAQLNAWSPVSQYAELSGNSASCCFVTSFDHADICGYD